MFPKIKYPRISDVVGSVSINRPRSRLDRVLRPLDFRLETTAVRVDDANLKHETVKLGERNGEGRGVASSIELTFIPCTESQSRAMFLSADATSAGTLECCKKKKQK